MADVGLLAAHGDAFEALELADHLFNARQQRRSETHVRDSVHAARERSDAAIPR